MSPGRLELHLGVSVLAGNASHVAECPDLGPDCAGPTPPAPFEHHVSLFTTETSLDASYGVLPWLAVEARLALRTATTRPTYTELDGAPKLVAFDPHHHDETLVGPTDPWLVLRFSAARSKLVTSARLGVTLPLGRTEPNPYVLGEQGKRHEHIQFGSGTLVPVVGLGLFYTVGPVDLDLSAVGLFSIYPNDKGFRAPSRLFPSFRVTVPFLDGALRPFASVDVPCETGERWDGRPGLEGGDGRVDLLVGGGVSFRFKAPWYVDVAVRGHAASLTRGATFDYPGVVQIGLGTDVDLGAVAARGRGVR